MFNAELVNPSAVEFVSIDPGGTTGVVTWDANAKLLDALQLNREEFEDFLEKVSPAQVICEEYIVNPHVRHGGQKVETLRIIGAIESYCRRNKILLEMQRPQILTIAQKWSGKKMPKNHGISHWVSAYLHGYYFLHRKGLIKARVLDD